MIWNRKLKQKCFTLHVVYKFIYTIKYCLKKVWWKLAKGDVPVEIPSGSDFRHTVLAMRVIGYSPLSVLESTTTNGVNTNEEDEHDNVKNRYLLPISSNIFKNSSFARVTFIAQQIRVIIPKVTIRVLWHCCQSIVACCWWLATPWLWKYIKKIN